MCKSCVTYLLKQTNILRIKTCKPRRSQMSQRTIFQINDDDDDDWRMSKSCVTYLLAYLNKPTSYTSRHASLGNHKCRSGQSSKTTYPPISISSYILKQLKSILKLLSHVNYSDLEMFEFRPQGGQFIAARFQDRSISEDGAVLLHNL